jgi:hypothetical protein
MFKMILLVPLFASSVCLAQFDASVLGTVTDPTSAAVVGAKVKLDNLKTGVSESAVTDSNGIYRFLNVPIGQYHVITQAPGFKTVTTEEFSVTVEARQRVDIRLEIGEVSSTVTVSGAAAVLETDTTNRSQVIQHEAIVDLPLNGRAYADLALLAPGVRHAVQSNTASRDGAYNVNGMRSAFTPTAPATRGSRTR